MGVQRGSIVSVCAAAYELPTLGVDGSRSLKGYEVMAHPPTRNIQNVSVALYCAGGLPSGFLFQRARSFMTGPLEQGKGEKLAPQVRGGDFLPFRLSNAGSAESATAGGRKFL